MPLNLPNEDAIREGATLNHCGDTYIYKTKVMYYKKFN